MNIQIYTSKYSKNSAILLGKALDCPVYNPYQNTFYRRNTLIESPVTYNMGCSYNILGPSINNPYDIYACVNKFNTFERFKQAEVLYPPVTTDITVAKQWLEEDHIVVNRRTMTGKANDGLSFATKNAPNFEDAPIDNHAIAWTRYINHTRELRAYVFKGQLPIVFEKKEVDGIWVFNLLSRPKAKMLQQIAKAQTAFPNLVFSAFDFLECVTGDFYFLENNSAPSLQVHQSIIPRLVDTIITEYYNICP